MDLQLMGFCAGSQQGSWNPALGSLAPQYLEESASWCGGQVLESTSWEHVWTPGGSVCPEISA